MQKDNYVDKFPYNLIITRYDSESKIRLQIERGNRIRNLNISTKKDLTLVESEKSRWSKYNEELLSRIFDNQVIVNEYKNIDYSLRFKVGGQSFEKVVDGLGTEIDKKINFLEAIIERLDLIPEAKIKSIFVNKNEMIKPKSKDIFIVHGKDDTSKGLVSGFIEKLGLNPIILHKQPNAGRTIIEKFEDYSNVCFAVVLLTPDDTGYSKNEPSEAKSRARQNVIFELGYFIGKLGRENVCALFKEGVEIPSDYHGVLYLPIDINNEWQFSLAREIKQAGIEIDLNKII